MYNFWWVKYNYFTTLCIYMINDKKQTEKIFFDEVNSAFEPMMMKELIMRGYRVMAASPLSGKIEIEYQDTTLLNTQRKRVHEKRITERRFF